MTETSSPKPTPASPVTAAVRDGFMEDAAGRLVPIRNIRSRDLMEDELVRRLHQLARIENQRLVELRKLAFVEIAAFGELLAEEYGAKLGGPKGNTTLATYDGRLRVLVAINDVITFGPELQVAKTLIDECLERWSEGSNENLKAVIIDAFDVRKEGKVQVGQILRLRRLEITDPTWLRAMDAINDAIRIDCTSSYVRFHERAQRDGKYEQLQLDIARV